MNKPKVAFICVHNSCRSQIAEALGKHFAANVFESYSAGTETKPQINQDAVRLIKQLYGIDMEKNQHSKLLADMRYIIGTGDKKPKAKHSVNILGEYNIGADAWEEERILKRCGLEIVTIFTGDGAYETMKNAHLADLNLVMCHRSINYVAEMMKTKYGIDWLKINFIGVGATCRSLRMIAQYFGDTELSARIEEVISDELENIHDDMEHYRRKLKGKTAGIFSGGSRSHHYQKLLEDFGVETVIAGYEFAHRDDFEGRDILPFIKPDADSKNIETITVEADPVLYRERYSEAETERLKKEGVELDTYGGMMQEMDTGNIVVDDYNFYETDALVKKLKPDIFLSGLKDKYSVLKDGCASRQIHSYDYSGPYSGFMGAVNFGRDISMAIYCAAWGLVQTPWKSKSELSGTFVGGEL